MFSYKRRKYLPSLFYSRFRKIIYWNTYWRRITNILINTFVTDNIPPKQEVIDLFEKYYNVIKL